MAAPRVLITDLPEQAVATGTDLLVVQNGATSKKMLVSKLTTASNSAVDAHINQITDAHDASAISAVPNTAPMGDTTVQGQLGQAAAAVVAAQSAVDAHLADTVDAHDASAVSFIPVAGMAATDVQAALAELWAAIQALP